MSQASCSRRGPDETVAGWVVMKLGRLGTVGDVVEIPADYTIDAEDDAGDIRYELEVAEVRGNRITRVKLSKTDGP